MLEAGNRWAFFLLRPRRNNYFHVRLILTLLHRELKWHSTSSVHVGWIWKTLESEPSAKEFYLSNESRRLPWCAWVIQSNSAFDGTGTDRTNSSRQKQEETAADSTPRITLPLGHRSAIGIRSNQIGLAHIHNWSIRQILIFLHQEWICTKRGILYSYLLRICTSMNAAKVAASMVLADRPRQALLSMKVTIIGRCRSNNEWLTLVSFCSLAASNLGQGTVYPPKSKYCITEPSPAERSRTNVVWCILLTMGIYYIHIYTLWDFASSAVKNSWQRHLPPLPASKLQEHPVRMRNRSDPMSSLNMLWWWGWG